MFSFYNPIFLGCMWAREMMNNAIRRTKIYEGIICEFSNTICSKSLGFEIKLILSSGFEILEYIKNIRFIIAKISLSEFGEIIHKNNVVFKVIHRKHRGRTPHITMNRLKRLRRNEI